MICEKWTSNNLLWNIDSILANKIETTFYQWGFQPSIVHDF